MMEYRVEQKYLVTEDTIAYLKKRLEACMDYDAHAGVEGYLIRSIYFDDMYDSCFHENEDGIDPREKYRIRAYNHSDQIIHLERKAKRRGFTKKEAESLTPELCHLYMKGIVPDLLCCTKENNTLQKQLYGRYLANRMQPVCVVEYERVALVDGIGNVRITFDRNLGVTGDCRQFFEETIPMNPVLPQGVHILEVKYDELLPDAYKKILQECSLQKTNFSKYYFGRIAMKRERGNNQ